MLFSSDRFIVTNILVLKEPPHVSSTVLSSFVEIMRAIPQPVLLDCCELIAEKLQGKTDPLFNHSLFEIRAYLGKHLALNKNYEHAADILMPIADYADIPIRESAKQDENGIIVQPEVYNVPTYVLFCKCILVGQVYPQLLENASRHETAISPNLVNMNPAFARAQNIFHQLLPARNNIKDNADKYDLLVYFLF